MSILDYATRHGWQTKPDAAQWFKEHPEAAEQVRVGRANSLPWSKIHQFLQEEYDSPFTSIGYMRHVVND